MKKRAVEEKVGREKRGLGPARESETPVTGLLFEIDSRRLRTMLGRRVVRRRALAGTQRRMLERLIKKSKGTDACELTRERLERSIQRNEDFAAFLELASDHLLGRRGVRRLTASELATLDLMPRDTLY